MDVEGFQYLGGWAFLFGGKDGESLKARGGVLDPFDRVKIRVLVKFL